MNIIRVTNSLDADQTRRLSLKTSAGGHCVGRGLFITAKLLKQGIDIIKFEKHFLNSTTGTQS